LTAQRLGGLITGVPRSGTTLCCHVLNQQSNVVALHEPINPGGLAINAENALELLSNKYVDFAKSIYEGTAFEHGNDSGLDIDNPVGLGIVDGKRAVTAKRGQIVVTKYIGKDIQLFVKQNALFTAYLERLTPQFSITCIVRNPVDVLLSWWTVDLPVSRGRLPAGEKNDAHLKQALAQQNEELSRQLTIYQWFLAKYACNNVSVVRYEDIIATNGAALFKAAGVQQTLPLALANKVRQYSPQIIERLQKVRSRLIEIDCKGLYSKEQIAKRIDGLIN